MIFGRSASLSAESFDYSRGLVLHSRSSVAMNELRCVKYDLKQKREKLSPASFQKRRRSDFSWFAALDFLSEIIDVFLGVNFFHLLAFFPRRH